LEIPVPAVPRTGRPVWTVGIGLVISRFVGVFPATSREAVLFEVQEVVDFVKTGATDLIDGIVDDGVGFA
jgi:hypothetical protein